MQECRSILLPCGLVEIPPVEQVGVLQAFRSVLLERCRSHSTSTKHARSTKRSRFLPFPKAHKLLAACAADSECRALLAATAIGLFAGRRTSEFVALDWQSVHLTGEEQFIEVAARKAKNRQRRIVSISNNLSSWLKPVARVAGPIVPDCYRERHERLQTLAKLTPWARNILRHSFGFYHFAFQKKEALTAA